MPKLSASLWLDEGLSISAARHLPDFDAQRPLYFLFLRGWMTIAHSEIALRLPSVVFGLSWIALCYFIARRLGGTFVALISSLFAALSTSQAFHSQEIRMYSLVPLLLGAAAVCYAQWLERGRSRWLIAHAVFGYAAMLTFTPAAIGLAAMWMIAVFLARSSRHIVLGTIAAAALVGIAWFPFALRAATATVGTSWIPTPKLAQLAYLQGWTFVGDSLYFWLPGLISPWVYRLLSLVILGLAVYSAIGTRWMYVAIWYFSIVVLIFVVSVVVRPVWQSRYLSPFMPALFMLSAAGIAKLRATSRIGAFGLLGLILFLQVGSLIADRGPLEDWRGAATLVKTAGPEDVVLVALDSDTVAWTYYYQQASVERFIEETGSVDAWFGRLVAILTGMDLEHSVLWVVLRTSSSLSLDDQAVLRERLAPLYNVGYFSYKGVDVIRVSKKVADKDRKL